MKNASLFLVLSPLFAACGVSADPESTAIEEQALFKFPSCSAQYQETNLIEHFGRNYDALIDESDYQDFHGNHPYDPGFVKVMSSGGYSKPRPIVVRDSASGNTLTEYAIFIDESGMALYRVNYNCPCGVITASSPHGSVAGCRQMRALK